MSDHLDVNDAQSMAEPWLQRLITMKRFPVDVNISVLIQLAENGFRYSGRGTSLKCFLCGMELRWHDGCLSTPLAQEQNSCTQHSLLMSAAFKLHFPGGLFAVPDTEVVDPQPVNGMEALK
jgi:hypothetical protein